MPLNKEIKTKVNFLEYSLFDLFIKIDYERRR